MGERERNNRLPFRSLKLFLLFMEFFILENLKGDVCSEFKMEQVFVTVPLILAG